MAAWISAQPVGAESSALRAVPTSTNSAIRPLDARPDSDRFADAKVEADIGWPGAEIMGNDFFVAPVGLVSGSGSRHP